jgi:hypothetical protein
MKTIPFNEFMAGSISFPTNLPIAEGYLFFGALGVALIGLHIIEKHTNIKVSESNVKFMMFFVFLGAIGWFVFKSSFVRHLMMGF